MNEDAASKPTTEGSGQPGQEQPVEFKEFLESGSSGRLVSAANAFTFALHPRGGRERERAWGITLPTLDLPCPNGVCRGVRRFQPSPRLLHGERRCEIFTVEYTCANCQRTEKTYVLYLHEGRKEGDRTAAPVAKIGEWPPRDLGIPERLLTVLGDDYARELFRKGRLAESEGLGIGAFTYYRRVVERQREHVVDEMIRVAQRVQAFADQIETLK